MLLKKKIIGRSRFYDIVHKGWVNVCVLASLVTFGSAVYAGSRVLKEYVTSKTVESTNREADTDLAPTVNEKQGELL